MEGQDPVKTTGDRKRTLDTRMTEESRRQQFVALMRRKAQHERDTTRGRLALLQIAAGG